MVCKVTFDGEHDRLFLAMPGDDPKPWDTNKIDLLVRHNRSVVFDLVGEAERFSAAFVAAGAQLASTPKR